MKEFFAAADKAILNNGNGTVDIPKVSADSVFHAGLGIIYWAAGLVSVIVIIIAGIYYTTSNGNPAQVTRAKNGIIAGVVGLVVVLMAFTITQFVLGGV